MEFFSPISTFRGPRRAPGSARNASGGNSGPGEWVETSRGPAITTSGVGVVAGLEVDTNTNSGGAPPPREEDPDLGAGGSILASRVAER
eukprot:553132-Pyramimonas_sp.AAC.1